MPLVIILSLLHWIKRGLFTILKLEFVGKRFVMRKRFSRLAISFVPSALYHQLCKFLLAVAVTAPSCSLRDTEHILSPFLSRFKCSLWAMSPGWPDRSTKCIFASSPLHTTPPQKNMSSFPFFLMWGVGDGGDEARGATVAFGVHKREKTTVGKAVGFTGLRFAECVFTVCERRVFKVFWYWTPTQFWHKQYANQSFWAFSVLNFEVFWGSELKSKTTFSISSFALFNGSESL